MLGHGNLSFSPPLAKSHGELSFSSPLAKSHGELSFSPPLAIVSQPWCKPR